jgi:tRNA threonylcarbamoyladenosine biosynthesis protein TsaE
MRDYEFRSYELQHAYFCVFNNEATPVFSYGISVLLSYTMDTTEHTSQNLEETHALAKNFLQKLGGGSDPPPADSLPEHAMIVALYGDLGSGKTSFVQGVAKALGVEKTVISPTFVIERVYPLVGQTWENLVHIDCYRFENKSEADSINLHEVMEDPRNLIFIEWAEKIEDKLPPNISKIYFKHIDENIRRITISI